MNFKGAVLQVLFSEVNLLHNRRKGKFLLIGYCAVEKNIFVILKVPEH